MTTKTGIRNDPDSYTDGVEIVLAPTANPPTLRLVNTGNLSGYQATGQSIYSWLKLHWIADNTIRFYPFPMDMTTPEQATFLDGWEPYDDASRKKIATCGWKEQTTAKVSKREYCGVVSVPPSGVTSSDQPYYEHVSQTPTDFYWAGPVNEAVQIYGDSSNGNFDRRTTDITVYCRQQQKTFASASVFANYSVTTLGTGVYRVGLSVATDSKATVADTGIDANSDGTADVSPYSGMVFQRHASNQSIAMAGGSYNFRWTLNCNGARAQRGYEYAMWILRKNSDIDAGSGTRNGKTAPQFTSYVGDTLYTALMTSGEGVALTNFDSADINSVVFVDNTGAQRTFPYTAALRLVISDDGKADASAVVAVYPTSTFGQAGCTPVLDASNNPMVASVSGASTISFTYDWTSHGNVAVTAVILGVSSCKNYRATGNIVQSTENQISLAAGPELNYLNP